MGAGASLVVPYRRRVAIVLGLALLIISFLTWPWGWLPLKWRYPLDYRAAEKKIVDLERFRERHKRFPRSDEVEQGIPAFGYDVGPAGDRFWLTMTEGFDLFFVYDSASKTWRRFGDIVEN